MDVDAVGPPSQSLSLSNPSTITGLPVDQRRTICDKLEKTADNKMWTYIFDTYPNDSAKRGDLSSTVLWTITTLLSNTDLKDNFLSTSTEDAAAEVLDSFTAEERNMFWEGLKKALTDKNWEDLLAHPRLLLPVTNSGIQSPVGRPIKRRKLASEDGATISPMSDAAATSQTAAHGVGRGSPPTKIALDDAIQQAKALLKQNSDSLKLAATTDPDLDTSNPFFVDGLGALYDADPDTKDRVVNLFQPGTSRTLFNVTGSGKTRLLVEGLCRFWGFYFTPDLIPFLGSVDFPRSVYDVYSSIDGGIAFTPNLPNLPNRCCVSHEHNRIIARTLFLGVLLARLLVLEAFLHAGADIPANELRRRWTHLQLVPSVLRSQFSCTEDDIFASVYSTIERYGDNDPLRVDAYIKMLRRDSRISSTSPFFVVLDDAQICSNMCSGAFHSEDAGPDQTCSLLREIFTTWGPPTLMNTAVLVSGTSYSLTKVLRSSTTPLGAVDGSVFFDTGAFVCKELQAAYIMRHVVLDEDSREEVLCRAWQWLRGRHRFTVGFVYVLQRCGTKNASSLLTHYVHALTDYFPTDGSNNMKIMCHGGEPFPEFRSIYQHLQKLGTDGHLRHLAALAINTFTLRHKPHFVHCSQAIDAIEIGMARCTTSNEMLHKGIVIDEPLIIASALKYFQSFREWIRETSHESNGTDRAMMALGPLNSTGCV